VFDSVYEFEDAACRIGVDQTDLVAKDAQDGGGSPTSFRLGRHAEGHGVLGAEALVGRQVHHVRIEDQAAALLGEVCELPETIHGYLQRVKKIKPTGYMKTLIFGYSYYMHNDRV
jgi:hypothetical protein